MLSVSVVVPIRNAARTLPNCLAALERLDPAPFEIILVDNGSTDESLALIRAFAGDRAAKGVRVLEEPRRGAAAARNTGAWVAAGDVIAFTDADCAPDPSWLRMLTEPFGDSSVLAVAGRVLAAPASTALELFSALYTLQSLDKPARHHRWTPWEGGFPTANFAVRCDSFKQIGGFDKEVEIYGEDYDLCARLYDRNAVIVYTPDAGVRHHHRTTLSGLLCQAFGFGRSHPYLLRRHAVAGLWLDFPVRSFFLSGFPMPAWIDLASADKKVLAVLIAGAMYAPALLLLPLYLLWLAMATAQRAGSAGRPVAFSTSIGLAGLLLMKSAAMTAGRWWGSLKYGAICV